MSEDTKSTEITESTESTEMGVMQATRVLGGALFRGTKAGAKLIGKAGIVTLHGIGDGCNLAADVMEGKVERPKSDKPTKPVKVTIAEALRKAAERVETTNVSLPALPKIRIEMPEKVDEDELAGHPDLA